MSEIDDADLRYTAQRRKAQRQAQIAEFVLEQGDAAATDLADRFSVSIMTIHRDLDVLAAQGIVRRYHGGVSAHRSNVFEPDASYRLRLSVTAKAEIAAAAVDLVQPGMAIMLDDSTTTLALARLLTDIPDLTLATNFLETMKVLAEGSTVRLIGLGGDYSPTHRSFLGQACVDAVAALRVGILFASTSAMTADTAFHQEQEIVSVKRAMMAAAERRVLLMDHSKINRTALYRVSTLTEWDTVIVDSQTPEEQTEEIRAAGAHLVVTSAA